MKSRDSATRSVRSPAVRHVCLSLAIAVCLSACRGSPTASLDAAAEFYVRAALALGERDADSLDIYYGPAPGRRTHVRAICRSTTSGPRRSVHRVARRAAVRQRRGRGPAALPLRQPRAIVSRIDIVRGARPPFVEEARTLFGLERARMGDALARLTGKRRTASPFGARAAAAGRRRSVSALRGVRPADF